ncbi:hypothetical protein AB0I81_42805 [Nonomuraea sp. NPDC050404]|uniref:hypothetical protein n=1 Tax=Nonomuraea sp. NPDC050404 TaxID=3155783 RepID=UPI0033CE6D62
MLRYRLAVPALLITGAYAIAVTVSVVLALNGGDLGPLWRLTLLYEVPDDTSVTWQNVLALVLLGVLSAWVLWQSLRGPVKGARPAAGRDVRRLRAALYAAVATWLLYAVLPIWPWWAQVFDSLVMAVVVVLFQPVLRRTVRLADLATAAGVLSYLAVAAGAVFDELDLRAGESTADIAGLGGLAALFWLIMALVAQWQDGRFRRATVWYGAGYLLAPVLLLPVLLLMELLGGFGDVSGELSVATEILLVAWLARSANDLADPHARQTPSPPLLAVPPAFTAGSPLAARAGFAACAVVLIPGLGAPLQGNKYFAVPRMPRGWLDGQAGDAAAMLWRTFELFTAFGGLAVVVLFAAYRGTRIAFLTAMGALLLTAVTVATGMLVFPPYGEPALVFSAAGEATDFRPPLARAPMWFIAECGCAAVLLWWARIARPRINDHPLPAP